MVEDVPAKKFEFLAWSNDDRDDARLFDLASHKALEVLSLYVIQTVDLDHPTTAGWSLFVIQAKIITVELVKKSERLIKKRLAKFSNHSFTNF